MSSGCSVMPNSRIKIVGDEFLTAIDYDDEFHVNLLFDRPICRPMCTHMGQAHTSALLSSRPQCHVQDITFGPRCSGNYATVCSPLVLRLVQVFIVPTTEMLRLSEYDELLVNYKLTLRSSM